MTLEGTCLPAGYVNERVQTSDWEGSHTVGGFLYGSNWPEASAMLTYVEVPGVYADLETGRAWALDSVRCGVEAWDREGGMTLWVENPTAYGTEVTLLADHPSRRTFVTQNYFQAMRRIRLEPGQRVAVSLQ